MSDMPLTDNPLIIALLVVIAVAIVYPIMKVMGKGSMTQRKQEEIEQKRAALIAKRKAAAKAADQSANPTE